MAATPLWTPGHARAAASEMERFRRSVAEALPVGEPCRDSDALWAWSVAEPGPFWQAVWDWSGVIGEPGEPTTVGNGAFWETTFLPGARLNVAENLLARRPGVEDHEVAISAWTEDGESRSLTWAGLRAEVAAAAAVFRAAGVGPGDRVAAWMPHVPETIVAFLAASSIGAVFTSTSADFGVDGVVDRFGQVEPTVLVAADGYTYGGKMFDCLGRLAEIRRLLPTVNRTLVVGNLNEAPALQEARIETDPLGADGGEALQLWTAALDAHRLAAEPVYERLPFDHPLYILYSSGTTGKPKCIVHRAGGVLLKHLSEHRFHCDIQPGDRVFFFTTCGWMMWNWLVSALGVGAAIVLYDGNPQHGSPGRLFDLATETDVTLLGVSAKYIDGVMKAGDRPGDRQRFSSLRTICSTGSPLSPEGFSWVYDAVAADVHLVSMSGRYRSVRLPGHRRPDQTRVRRRDPGQGTGCGRRRA